MRELMGYRKHVEGRFEMTNARNEGGSTVSRILMRSFEVVRQCGRDYIDERERNAAFEQYCSDVEAAVGLPADVTNDRAVIIRVLREYWHIEGDDAEGLLHEEMRVRAPLRRLGRFLVEKRNYLPVEVERYLDDNRVKSRLRHESKLSTLTAEQLYREIEGHGR